MNKVITKDFSENLSGGFMVCGINYGYSLADERAERSGVVPVVEPLSFFSDVTVRQGDAFRKRVIKWLAGWGIPLAERPDEAKERERSFFQCNWLDTQTRGVSGTEALTVADLIHEADGFLELLEQRKPQVVFLFGSSLIQALNATQVRERVIRILGPRKDPERVVAELPEYNGRRFVVLVQTFGETVVVGCPHPRARGLSDAYMAALKLPAMLLEKF